MANDLINAEIPKLDQSAILLFYVLDATESGGGFFRFFAGTAERNEPVVWQGNTYTPIPLETNGFEFKATGSPPRPTLIFGNVGGQFSALCLNFNDLIGARVIRKRTFARFLDNAVTADATQAFPDDVFFIERKVTETKGAVEFELATNMDVDDVLIPKRQFIANLCGWKYRGGECGYTGDVKGELNDTPPGIAITNRGTWNVGTTYHTGDQVSLVGFDGIAAKYWCFADGGTGIAGEAAGPTNPTFWKKDECSKRVRGCELRFIGDPSGLPFGGFPAADRQR